MKRSHIFSITTLFLLIAFLIPLEVFSNYNEDFSQVITIDKTDSSAINAKKKALQESEKKAVNQLFYFLHQGLVPKTLDGKTTPISLENIKSYLTGFEILKEKNSKTRYIAKIRYQFNKKALDTLIKNNGWIFQLPPKEKLLIIPMVIEKSPKQINYKLWSSTPWHKAWKREEKKLLYFPIDLPLGDVDDVSTLQPNAAIDGLYPAFNKLKERYKTSLGIAVVVAQPIYEVKNLESSNGSHIEKQNILTGVKIYLLHGLTPDSLSFPIFFVMKKNQETDKEFFNRAVHITYEHIINQWRKQLNSKKLKNLLYSKEIIIPFSSSYDWFFWEKNIESITQSSNITNFHLKSLSMNKANIVLSFYGDLSTLQRQLKRINLTLSLYESNWYLTDDRLKSFVSKQEKK